MEEIKAPGIELVQTKPQNQVFTQPKSYLRYYNDFLVYEISTFIPAASAADSTLYPLFYTARQPCFILEASERHTAAGAASSTIDIQKIPNGTAPGAIGRSVLNAKFAADGTVNTLQIKLATISLAGAQLAAGDSLYLIPGGTITNLRNVSVTVLIGVLMKNLPTSANI